MKLLAFLAVIALAHADQVRVVSLPEVRTYSYSRPSMGQYIVPNYVIDTVKADAAYDELKLEYVDSLAAPSDSVVPESELPAQGSVFVETKEEFFVPQPVKLGEAPEPVIETDAVEFAAPIALEAVKIAEPQLPEVIAEEISPVRIAESAFETPVDSVRFVDAPMDISIPEPVMIAEPQLPEVIAEEISPMRIAEAPLPPLETPDVDAVRLVDAPIHAPMDIPFPEPVMIAEAPLPVVESAPEAIKIVEPNFRDYRGKVFDDPLLR